MLYALTSVRVVYDNVLKEKADVWDFNGLYVICYKIFFDFSDSFEHYNITFASAIGYTSLE